MEERERENGIEREGEIEMVNEVHYLLIICFDDRNSNFLRWQWMNKLIFLILEATD